jgi:hypothetical protein
VGFKTLGTALARFMLKQGGITKLVDAVMAVISARSAMSKDALRALLTGAATPKAGTKSKPRPAALSSALTSPSALSVSAIIDHGQIALPVVVEDAQEATVWASPAAALQHAAGKTSQSPLVDMRKMVYGLLLSALPSKEKAAAETRPLLEVLQVCTVCPQPLFALN